MKMDHIPFATCDWAAVPELADGRHFTLTPGMSYQVADNAEPHRSTSPQGATLFIVD